ncbi:MULTISPECIES: hypothetical protein [Brevibacterium]|uniref:Uncharacterized protein n=1 Tax=Brevibacterium casei TaxID=33889 RepID=A0A7T9TPE4_9MICO|nr:hypothetical protein [Brevibacterium casei]MBE4695764.1 hypothetical protein [Brevibacterium casei]MBY3578886.1 hypothetical protein [Brevibacterium casei]MCT1445699.1 hypothetical protein [Brevibacterium casei]MCT1549922.1 hypothetical protein [Brevibacterium casei]MCT1558816.1 hypothetical protein [Brevibacterium casei]
MPSSVSTLRQSVRDAVFPKSKLMTTLSNGTNGWMSSWGTNAHGEIAGCPPPRR